MTNRVRRAFVAAGALTVGVATDLALEGQQRQLPIIQRPAAGPVAERIPPQSPMDELRRALASERERDSRPYSPLEFYDLLTYEQAFPGTVWTPVAAMARRQAFASFDAAVNRGGGDGVGDSWFNLGPSTVGSSGNASGNISGRVSALAISKACSLSGSCRLWVGTAGGGVWRTEDAMNTTDPKWKWIGHKLGTNSIGALAIDPNDRASQTIFVGTGETNSPHNSGAGTGLYRSTNGGDTWKRVPTMILDTAVQAAPIDFTYSRGISTVVVEPGDSNVLYVATTTAMFGMTGVRGGQSQVTGYPQPRVGLYKTTNLGESWTLIWTPPLDPVVPPNPNALPSMGDTMIGVRHVKLDPKDSRIIYATAFNNAIHRSAPSLEGGDASFKPVYAIVSAARFRDLAMFDLTVKDGRTRLYVYNGTEAVAPQGLYRLDNADVPAASLVTGTGANLTNSSAWIKLSSDVNTEPGFTSRRMCTSQCFYDLVVATPAGQPDVVVIGGVAQTTFGEPTIRSTNAGVGFSSFGDDAQPVRNQSHVDVRAVVFHPRDPNIAFVGSDGGVVRNDGQFVDMRSRCPQFSFGSQPTCQVMFAAVPNRVYFLNRGLQTLQFYNVAIDPVDPLRRLIGGLQDNSTVWYSGVGPPLEWSTLFPSGDGTSASGFHPTRPDVLFASFQSNRFFTNFRNGDPAWWVRMDDPFFLAAERDTVTASTGRQFLTFDKVRPDTQFTAFQHVWRTQNNGGDKTFLETNCRTSGGTAQRICGDWQPLGVPYPFDAGTTPSSPSRLPGDLTSTFYGTDRSGGLVVAAERTPADAGTLWAATSFGRLFISKNVDGPAAAVEFVRIDSFATPTRFVTRIIVDRNNPNVALVSYSGFNALTPSTPGHVFRVTYNPATQLASFVSLDFDLGDMPINTMAYDDLTGDLYAGTDFGPLILQSGVNQWMAAGKNFPQALMVDLEIDIEKRVLVAATHGLGVFGLKLRSP